MLDANRLINELAIEWNSERAEKESCIFIGGCGCVEGDVATGDHFDRVPMRKGLFINILVSQKMIEQRGESTHMS
jgi:hypothetical protein